MEQNEDKLQKRWNILWWIYYTIGIATMMFIGIASYSLKLRDVLFAYAFYQTILRIVFYVVSIAIIGLSVLCIVKKSKQDFMKYWKILAYAMIASYACLFLLLSMNVLGILQLFIQPLVHIVFEV